MKKQIITTLLAIAASGCGVSKDEFAAAQRDAAENQKKYEEQAQKTAALEKKVAELEQKNKELTTTSAKLEAKSAQYEQLASSLQNQIASGQIEISELRGKMTVKLKDKILFASGSAALNKDGKAALDAVAEAFKGIKDKNVIVAGYTDDVPTGKSGFKDNWDLSTARAISVVRYLQSKDVPPELLGAAGFSQFRPLAPNDSAENRSLNRRIEIALTAADYTPPTVETPKAQR
jgi:chemotaxis protein MotB